MQIAAVPHNEMARMDALRALEILDSAPEAEFTALVHAASLVCGKPISLISLIDTERQWFKANIGLEGATETPRDIAFCSHAIQGDDVFVVEDATEDVRFHDNPLVASAPDIRFYAGAPLRTKSGHRVGTLCVIDRQPGVLSVEQRAVLAALAEAVSAAMEGRRAARQEQRNLQALQLSELRFRSLSEASPHGVFFADAKGSRNYTNPQWQAIFGLGAADSLGEGWQSTLHPDEHARVSAEWRRCVAEARPFDCEYRILRRDGQVRIVNSRATPLHGPEGEVIGFVGSVEDVTLRMAQAEEIRKSQLFLARTGMMAGVGGWEIDLLDGSIYWSDETCRIYGVAPGHTPTMDEAISYYAPEARPVIAARVTQAMQDGSSWDLELPFIRADGERLWVRVVGAVDFLAGVAVRMSGAFQDVTERVKERLALEDAKQRQALATGAGGIGLWDYTVANDHFTWDAQVIALYGGLVSTHGTNYAGWRQCVHPDDRREADTVLRDAMADAHSFDIVFRIVLPDGTLRHLRSAGRIHRDAAGQAQRVIGAQWDVSESRRMTAALAEQHELLQVTLESIGDAVITTDADGEVAWLNPVAERLTGWRNAEAQGLPLAQVFNTVQEATRTPAGDPLAATLASGAAALAGAATPTLLLSRSGAEYGIEQTASPIRNEDGKELGAVLVFHDVTEQRRVSGEMRYRATHDALTGLVNRAEFEARLGRLYHSARDATDPAHAHAQHALLFIDLDQFKQVNDACGHGVGDQLLQEVAKLLADATRARDTLARLGGDEFAILLENCGSEPARRVAQKICDRMADFRFTHGGRHFPIGTSIGLVPVDARWSSSAALMQAADSSCYAAKEAGRNRVHVWFDSDEASRTRHGEMQWNQRIEHALAQDRFVLYAQRIVPLGAVVEEGLYAEVLVRMLGDDGALILPGVFMPAAERFHLAARVDRWVVRKALAWLAQLAEPGHCACLSINLSTEALADRVFHRWLVEQLEQAGSAMCRRLCFDIGETAATSHLADAASLIAHLRALGVLVALDDFGGGASAFGYLKNMPVDFLKIDGQFVRDLLEEPLDAAAVRCFADIAMVMGIETIAENVECEAVAVRLAELGVGFGQGYHLHQPVPIEAILIAEEHLVD